MYIHNVITIYKAIPCIYCISSKLGCHCAMVKFPRIGKTYIRALRGFRKCTLLREHWCWMVQGNRFPKLSVE